MADSITIEAATASIPSSNHGQSRLISFPAAFEDEPEPGLLPSFISKVKSTFTSSTSLALHATSTKHDKGLTSEASLQHGPTEAQQIAEAARNRAQKQAQTQNQPQRQGASNISALPSNVRYSHDLSSMPSPPIVTAEPINLPSQSSAVRAPVIGTTVPTNSASEASSPLTSSQSLLQTRYQSHSGDRQWQPSGVTPAQVTLSPVTSVTSTVLGKKIEDSMALAPLPRHSPKSHFGLQTALASSSRNTSFKAVAPALGNGRLRRSSMSTIPDSPSSVSLSAMIAANAELSQNYSYVPGFPLQQDDTHSVRSLGTVKRTGSVSKIIRRMRGEGLSKHYWMADENCKECYDCKSVFTAWRRKHHCRICGQIFCSRCAANIIGARRFGQNGMVRVCNLCLKIMEDYKDDEDDDRRSINSYLSSLRDRNFLDAAITPETPYMQSPFAASQLFSRQPNEFLTAIDEAAVPRHWNYANAEIMERPYTPDEFNGSETSDATEEGQYWYTARLNAAAPFRRLKEEEGAGDETQEDVKPYDGHLSTDTAETSRPGIELYVSRTRSRVGLSTMNTPQIEYPRVETIGSDITEPKTGTNKVEINLPLIGLRTRLSSRASIGGLNALLDLEGKEGLWRARSNSVAQRPEILSGPTLGHFTQMLEQVINEAELPNATEWRRVLSGLLLRVSTNLRLDIRSGDSIDVRTYVKIKKVPGGKISDSEYVDGIVITKNVAHKAMPRRLVNPRIMVVTFPLDYHRVETQLMSLDPIMKQERDYLRLLTKRIIDVRPHIVLVERSVSRVALEFLLEANIAVARGVKISAVHQVARCTQADVVASMDRLALESKLGRCAEFQIQTYEHDLIPGRRKTLMRFEGCHRDYGGTIILRGGDMVTLRKVKLITDFMSLVAYHLKNEAALFSDEHNIPPPRPIVPTDYQDLLDHLNRSKEQNISATSVPDFPGKSIVGIHEEENKRTNEAMRLTQEIAESLAPYLTTVLSASAAVWFPPPAPLAKMAKIDRILTKLRVSRDENEEASILQDERRSQELVAAIDREPALQMSASTEGIADADIVEGPNTSGDNLVQFVPRGSTRDPYRVLRKPEDVSQQSTLAYIEHEHTEQIRLWQLYNRRHAGHLRPSDFQGIVYLFSLGCESQEKPCVEPTRQCINFYQSDDQTVGQFLESLSSGAGQRCANKACERLMLFHFQLLVHGDRRLQIAMDQFPCPSPGHEDQIITWSYCRLCATPSPTTILREETWKMSWGAYLEHCFYPAVTRAGFSCPHDAYKDQIRYFAYRNIAIRIHNEGIDIYEPFRPPIILQIKAENRVILKNQEYESALHKIAAFFDSVLFRLRSFDDDVVEPNKVNLLRQALETLLSRAVADRDEMVSLLNRTYKQTPMVDVLALNVVLKVLQDKVIQWDSDFLEVEKSYMPSEKDLRRMTATHLKRLFATQDVFGSLDRNMASISVSEVDERDSKTIGHETPSQQDSMTPSIVATETTTGLSDFPLTIEDKHFEVPSVAETLSAPLSVPSHHGYDSDSTISAMPKNSFGRSPTADAASSGVDSDVIAFISRLPRRSRPAPSVADLVKKFQESVGDHDFDSISISDSPVGRPRSSGSIRRLRHHETEASDSDVGLPSARPRLRRGRTEQPTARNRDMSRPGLVSDGDRSYAANASRIPAINLRQSSVGVIDSAGYPQPSVTKVEKSAQVRPENALTSQLQPGAVIQSANQEGRPRIYGKGKVPRKSDPMIGTLAQPSPVQRTNTRRNIGNAASRVTSIARHFDRLSREAERDRQRRITMARGKRAGRVGVTKAKVQVFSNVRDAFKDEFDSDSSEADNEEDEEGSDISVDSTGRARPKRKVSSPTKNRSSLPDFASNASSSQIPLSETPDASISTLTLSEGASDLALTDRLQVQLAPFDTNAPLSSLPLPTTSQQSPAALQDDLRKPFSQMSQLSESELSSGGGERSSILKTLTGLWAFRAGDFTPLEYPMSAAEHIFTDSRVIIRENEPTSIISFTLNSKTYRDKLRSISASSKAPCRETFTPDDLGSNRAAWDMLSVDEAIENDDTSSGTEGTHLKYDFETGSSTIFCRIFFAEQFALLRSVCKCEDSFVESLSRCVQFDASGGKSGSAFLKTKDDRFIAKEISRLEMDALTKFAPAYFDYTRQAFTGQRPTVLAKIYGFFKIGYRNVVTGRAMRMNVLVMENLFYERQFSKIYDLKGSTRNRLIRPTGKTNEVLLDENLMEIIYQQPLYMREHSKRILRTALFNDTLFLSNLNVMDYSLVVGVDSKRHELVVGIVDYIRTFTWDKKLESWVKDSGFLGGGGKGEPTIVSPKQYKTRFRAAMDRIYFPSVPDRWTRTVTDEAPIDDEGISVVL